MANQRQFHRVRPSVLVAETAMIFVGTIPFLAGRIEAFYDKRARAPDGFAPDGIEAEFRRLHYDTANATHGREGGVDEARADIADHLRN